MTPVEPVLLYDGECGMCAALAGWALRHDRSGRLHVAPLQGPAAQGLLRALDLPTDDFDSLVFVFDRSRPAEGHALRSDGAVATLNAVGGVWSLLGAVLRVVPQTCRDAGYRWVARIRKRVFGGPRPLRPGAARARALE